MTPIITVLLPVYNGATYLRAAIDSILQQTFTDFELLIINDGSKDESATILAEYNDPRITIIHQENSGLAATLNKGIMLAKGKYIARQDQDDISLPTRLEKQLQFMSTHPDCALLGTHAIIWVDGVATERVHAHPTEHARLCFELLFNNPFVHSSVMFNTNVVRELGGYSLDPSRQPPEDFELWSRIARHHRIANLPENLLIYREVPTSMSRDTHNPFIDRLVTICAENIGCYTDTPEIANDIAALTHSAFHRLSWRIDIRGMEDCILAIGHYSNDIDVMMQARQRCAILSHQYTQYKLNKVLLLQLAKLIWRSYKKIKLYMKNLTSRMLSS